MKLGKDTVTFSASINPAFFRNNAPLLKNKRALLGNRWPLLERSITEFEITISLFLASHGLLQPFEESVNEGNLLTIGLGDQRGAVVELHDGRLRLIVERPVR